jgi:hypothetical protein
VAFAAARGCEEDRLVDEGVLTDEIEQVLEQSGERSAVDRARDDQEIRVLDASQLLFDRGRDLFARQGTGELRSDVSLSSMTWREIDWCSAISSRMADTRTLVFDGACRLPLTATTRRGRCVVFSTMLRRYAGCRSRRHERATRRNACAPARHPGDALCRRPGRHRGHSFEGRAPHEEKAPGSGRCGPAVLARRLSPCLGLLLRGGAHANQEIPRIAGCFRPNGPHKRAISCKPCAPASDRPASTARPAPHQEKAPGSGCCGPALLARRPPPCLGLLLRGGVARESGDRTDSRMLSPEPPSQACDLLRTVRPSIRSPSIDCTTGTTSGQSPGTRMLWPCGPCPVPFSLPRASPGGRRGPFRRPSKPGQACGRRFFSPARIGVLSRLPAGGNGQT